jgi:hypothetical protein
MQLNVLQVHAMQGSIVIHGLLRCHIAGRWPSQHIAPAMLPSYSPAFPLTSTMLPFESYVLITPLLSIRDHAVSSLSSSDDLRQRTQQEEVKHALVLLSCWASADVAAKTFR